MEADSSRACRCCLLLFVAATCRCHYAQRALPRLLMFILLRYYYAADAERCFDAAIFAADDITPCRHCRRCRHDAAFSDATGATRDTIRQDAARLL